MKKRFIINVLVVGCICLVLFGILQKGEVEKMKEKNKNLQEQKSQLESENRKLKESIQNLTDEDTSSTR